jgi:RNA polymerase sigma-70 factor (ECF subfamily)
VEKEKETESLEALRSGSDFVLKRIYEENRSKFLNYAKRFSISDEDVLDVYQDSYVIFYNNVMSGKLKNLNSSVSTYLFAIGKNLIFDKMRRENKKVQYKVVDFEPDEVDVYNLNFSGVETNDRQKKLFEHFSDLGTKCQEILSFFYYEGLTISEIMEVGGYNSENVVKATKSRCLKTLKDKMNAK